MTAAVLDLQLQQKIRSRVQRRGEKTKNYGGQLDTTADRSAVCKKKKRNQNRCRHGIDAKSKAQTRVQKQIVAQATTNRRAARNKNTHDAKDHRRKPKKHVLTKTQH